MRTVVSLYFNMPFNYFKPDLTGTGRHHPIRIVFCGRHTEADANLINIDRYKKNPNTNNMQKCRPHRRHRPSLWPFRRQSEINMMKKKKFTPQLQHR